MGHDSWSMKFISFLCKIPWLIESNSETVDQFPISTFFTIRSLFHSANLIITFYTNNGSKVEVHRGERGVSRCEENCLDFSSIECFPIELCIIEIGFYEIVIWKSSLIEYAFRICIHIHFTGSNNFQVFDFTFGHPKHCFWLC